MNSIPAYECRRVHSPLMPYFSAVYMQLVSIFQGAAIAIMIKLYFDYIFHVYGSSNGIKLDDPLLFIRVLVSIICFILIWHKYINHHQFIGWTLTYIDALFVFALGVIEAFIIYLAFYSKKFYFFYLFISLIYFYGWIAYKYAINRMKKDNVIKQFFEHYECKEECGIRIYNILVYFKNTSARYCEKFFIIIATLVVASVIVIYYYQIPEERINDLFEYIFGCIAFGSLLYFIVKYDIKRIMNADYIPPLNCKHTPEDIEKILKYKNYIIIDKKNKWIDDAKSRSNMQTKKFRVKYIQRRKNRFIF